MRSTDEEYGITDYVEEPQTTDEDTYGEGIAENDDFASFGGVDDDDSESDLRGMDIMDMDFNTFNEGRDSNRWTKADETKNKWETYGDEETVEGAHHRSRRVYGRRDGRRQRTPRAH